MKVTHTKNAHPAGEPTGGPQPCTDATDESEDTGAFTADELAYAYEFSDLYMAGDFGKGQTETQLTLPTGKHTLQLLFADLNHIPHQPPVISKKITISVSQ